jgi:hypothetical protein
MYDGKTYETIARDTRYTTKYVREVGRYGMFFVESIGYRVDPDGSRLLLYYGEIKIDVENRYHVTPRSRQA